MAANGRWLGTGRLLLRRRGFLALRGGGRAGTLDRNETPAMKPVDARPGAARDRHRHRALTALIGANIDLFGGAGARTTSHSVICSAIPPWTVGVPGGRTGSPGSRHLPRPAGTLSFRTNEIRLSDRTQV